LTPFQKSPDFRRRMKMTSRDVSSTQGLSRKSWVLDTTHRGISSGKFLLAYLMARHVVKVMSLHGVDPLFLFL
jgi:uncharacterized membrane protein